MLDSKRMWDLLITGTATLAGVTGMALVAPAVFLGVVFGPGADTFFAIVAGVLVVLMLVLGVQATRHRLAGGVLILTATFTLLLAAHDLGDLPDLGAASLALFVLAGIAGIWRPEDPSMEGSIG